MATTLLRKTVLTTAGIAATAGGIAGPAIAAHAAPTTTSVVADRKGHGERELDVRYEAQPNFYFCGPAAARNALSVQGKNIDVHAMAKEMGTTEAGTNSINDITPVLNKETGTSNAYKSVEISTPKADDKQTDTLRTDVVKTVDAGRAVVANIAGTATDTDGTTHSFEGGHYISVIGYRDDGHTVTIADSANPNTATYRMSIDNLADWIATRGYSTS
ncbi:phytochelatin synthase [Micromonospora tulbaghiae]|uniref:Phytochelatin synthase n=1 Tax=Micromonospora tulbaghiae TaxID=479978 RepID=A0A386WEA5_9ACTN|nr:C39 family peptidase [Micromonospora tulbaghiae]AYF26441.1 phytochelatin synthase [Micromonospora tulbaghiae]AYF27957.1 phytochelatin synthase [Micromonospora tulbaghiae]